MELLEFVNQFKELGAGGCPLDQKYRGRKPAPSILAGLPAPLAAPGVLFSRSLAE